MNDTAAPSLIVDGNSLIHRGYHALANSNLRTADGTPSWAIKAFWNFLSAATQRVGADAVTIGFDSKLNYRKNQYEPYKQGRSAKSDDLKTQLALAPAHFTQAGLQVVSCDGYEADDVLASVATRNQAAGKPSVILTSDKDSFSLITDSPPGVRVLRIVNGGHHNWPLLNSDRLRILCGVRPQHYRLYAAIKGDSSDNLPGVVGCGPKTAVKLIDHLHDSGDDIFELLEDQDAGGCALAGIIGVGAANKFLDPISRANLRRNMLLMAQDTTLAVGDAEAAELPVDREVLSAELRRWQLSIDETLFASTKSRQASLFG